MRKEVRGNWRSKFGVTIHWKCNLSCGSAHNVLFWMQLCKEFYYARKKSVGYLQNDWLQYSIRMHFIPDSQSSSQRTKKYSYSFTARIILYISNVIYFSFCASLSWDDKFMNPALKYVYVNHGKDNYIFVIVYWI